MENLASNPITITSLYAGLCALLFVVISLRVIFVRRANRVSLGTGGNDVLERRMRAQGNAAEYMPIALILLVAAELGGAPDLLLHAFGAVFLLGRMMHAYAFSFTDGHMGFRVSGMHLTIWPIMIMASYLVVMAVVRLAG